MNRLRKINPYIYLNNKQKVVYTFFLCLSIPFRLITEPDSGQEASWRIAINMAFHQSLVWGRDIVFTYGPLGFLQTRLSLYVNELPIILFSYFVWVNVMFMVFYFIKECKLISIWDLFVAFLIVFMFHYIVKYEVSTTLIYIILFQLLYSLKHKNYFSVVIATITGSLAIFIKLTYFFPLIVIFSVFLVTVLFLRTEMNKPRILLIYGCCFFLIVLLCSFLNVNFQQYISGGLHVVGAYNDAMMETPSKESILTWLLRPILPEAGPEYLSVIILAITFLITIPFLIKAVISLFSNRFHYITTITVFFCLLFLFLTFKYAFVRHGGLTYLYPPVLLYLLALLICFGGAAKSWTRFYVYFVCTILFFPSVLLINRHVMQQKSFAYYPLVKKAKGLLRKKAPALPINVNKSFTDILPETMLNKIGDNTVDVIPAEISLVHFNKLKYSPRPVIQSYAAYDAYLDTKNFNFYNSAHAPQFVIYCTNSTIDERYPFYDEPKTKFNLIKHYVVIDSFQNQLLLKRRKVSRIIETLREEKQEIQTNREYELSGDQFYQLSSFQIQYTKLGSIVRFLYQVPILKIVFYLEDGTIHTHRLVKSAVEVPVLINKYIADNNDFTNLVLNNFDSIATIKKFKIEAPEWAYKTKICVRHKWVILKEGN